MKCSWIGFKTVMMKPFTNFRHIYFQFLDYFIDVLAISIRIGIVYITSKLFCAIFHKQITCVNEEFQVLNFVKHQREYLQCHWNWILFLYFKICFLFVKQAKMKFGKFISKSYAFNLATSCLYKKYSKFFDRSVKTAGKTLSFSWISRSFLIISKRQYYVSVLFIKPQWYLL